jgi:hypothetical protein
MRTLTTTAVLPATTRLPAITRAKAPTVRRVSAWDRLFPRRRQATLYQRCLAVHMATAGTLSALR